MNFLNRLFKKDISTFNIYHPEIKDRIEFAFNLNGIKYYRFKETHLTRVMRYKYQVQFLNEYELGITSEDLIKYIDELEKHANKGQLGDVIIKARLIKKRATIYKDVDSFYKMASACYFTDSEEVISYDFKYNEAKIKLFKESKDQSFFLTAPMTTLFPQLESLLADSALFSKHVEELKIMKLELDSLIFSPSTSDEGPKKQIMLNRERFLMIRAECYQLRIDADGVPTQKLNKGQAMIDLNEVEFIVEGDSAEWSIISMKSSNRFVVKLNFYELQAKYEAYIDKHR